MEPSEKDLRNTFFFSFVTLIFPRLSRLPRQITLFQTYIFSFLIKLFLQMEKLGTLFPPFLSSKKLELANRSPEKKRKKGPLHPRGYRLFVTCLCFYSEGNSHQQSTGWRMRCEWTLWASVGCCIRERRQSWSPPERTTCHHHPCSSEGLLNLPAETDRGQWRQQTNTGWICTSYCVVMTRWLEGMMRTWQPERMSPPPQIIVGFT